MDAPNSTDTREPHETAEPDASLPRWTRVVRRLVPPTPARTPRRLIAGAIGMVVASALLVPVWMAASAGSSGEGLSVLAATIAALGAVLGGVSIGWLADRADGARRTDGTIYRSIAVAALSTATLTLLAASAGGTAVGAIASDASPLASAAVGSLVGGSLAVYLAPLLAIPSATIAALMFARSPGGRDNALLVLAAWVGLVALVGSSATELGPRVWTLAVGTTAAVALAWIALGSLRRLAWAVRLVRAPHRFWRLESTRAHAAPAGDLPCLAATDRSIVLMLRDPSAGGPFRGAEAFRPVALLPASAARWVLVTLARATVSLLGATALALATAAAFAG